MIHQMLAIWSLVPLPFLKPACTYESSQFTYCWSLAWRIFSMTLLAYSSTLLVAQLVKNCLQCGRPGFEPWAGKLPQRRERLPTPVFCSGEFQGLYSLWGHKESDTTEQLSLASLWNKCNYMVVWTFFSIALLWDWNENWNFSVLCPLLNFPNWLAYWVHWVQHFNSIIF